FMRNTLSQPGAFEPMVDPDGVVQDVRQINFGAMDPDYLARERKAKWRQIYADRLEAEQAQGAKIAQDRRARQAVTPPPPRLAAEPVYPQGDLGRYDPRFRPKDYDPEGDPYR